MRKIVEVSQDVGRRRHGPRLRDRAELPERGSLKLPRTRFTRRQVQRSIKRKCALIGIDPRQDQNLCFSALETPYRAGVRQFDHRSGIDLTHNPEFTACEFYMVRLRAIPCQRSVVAFHPGAEMEGGSSGLPTAEACKFVSFGISVSIPLECLHKIISFITCLCRTDSYEKLGKVARGSGGCSLKRAAGG